MSGRILILPVDVLSVFKSPMILIALFSLVMVVGLPYIMDNRRWPILLFQCTANLEQVDPEVKAEFEAMQKERGPASAIAAPNLDFTDSFANWMSGKSGATAPSEAKQKRKS
jgi:hypothetical protein